MNNQILIIYDFPILFDILKEIEKNVNFELLKLSEEEYSNFKMDNGKNYLLIANNKSINLQNQIILEKYPLRISKILEIININFLKIRFNQQSDIDLGIYKLNLNTRKIFNKNYELDLTEKEAEIITMAILPKYQNQGIGFLILTELEGILSEINCNKVFLEVASNNLKALHLYDKSGFKSIGIRKNYYSVSENKKVNAILMKKTI